MTTTNSKVYLVTGANIGLGLETTRQLALQEETKMVYLASRTESKALKAIEYLAKDHGIRREKLAFVPFDASEDKTFISQKALDAIDEPKIHGLIFNAGGAGHDKTFKPMGPNHVLDMVQINLIGHIHLLQSLMSNNLLQAGESTIVYSGSEAARGITMMGMAPPKLPDSQEAYAAMLDGSAFQKKKEQDPMYIYSVVKGISALYWSEWAKANPDYSVLTVSPGATSGTDFASHESLPRFLRAAFPILLKVMGATGYSHPVSVGAKRYVDAVNHTNEFAEFSSGTFVASVHNATGPVGDQTEHRNGKMYADHTKQEALYHAVQSVV